MVFFLSPKGQTWREQVTDNERGRIRKDDTKMVKTSTRREKRERKQERGIKSQIKRIRQLSPP